MAGGLDGALFIDPRGGWGAGAAGTFATRLCFLPHAGKRKKHAASAALVAIRRRLGVTSSSCLTTLQACNWGRARPPRGVKQILKSAFWVIPRTSKSVAKSPPMNFFLDFYREELYI
jgi:hypothetical protein